MKKIKVQFKDELKYTKEVHAGDYIKTPLIFNVLLLLSPREYKVIVGCVIQRKTLREMAGELSVSRHRVVITKKRATRRLKKLFCKYVSDNVGEIFDLVHESYEEN